MVEIIRKLTAEKFGNRVLITIPEVGVANGAGLLAVKMGGGREEVDKLIASSSDQLARLNVVCRFLLECSYAVMIAAMMVRVSCDFFLFVCLL